MNGLVGLSSEAESVKIKDSLVPECDRFWNLGTIIEKYGGLECFFFFLVEWENSLNQPNQKKKRKHPKQHHKVCPNNQSGKLSKKS